MSEKKEHVAPDYRLSKELLDDISKQYTLVQNDCFAFTIDHYVHAFIPIPFGNATSDEQIVDKLLSKCKGDLATNVKIETVGLYFGVGLFGRRATADIWAKR